MEQKTAQQKVELRKAKRMALSLLLLVAAVFVTTLFLPANLWILGVKAIAEAAMVGALADWFAVYALFRPVHLPFISKHTAIIPRNKEKIATNLGRFIQEKFLDTQSLIQLIQHHQPVKLLARWLIQPENSGRLGKYLLKIIGTFLELADDVRIQKLIRRGVHKAIDNIDLSRTGAILLESLTKNNRHQALLDTLIAQILELLKKPGSRDFIASQITHWLNSEHPRKARLLPTQWLGEQSAEWVSEAVNRLLDDINQDKQHQIRQGFDAAVQRFITDLKTSPHLVKKVESIKRYIKNDEAFNCYIGELWGDLRQGLKADSESGDSRVQKRIALAGQWFGETILSDPALQVSLNKHLEIAVRRMTPDFAAFITHHISDTVKSWDSKELAEQIEFNIGKDLQFIRINGTLVGGLIGLLLYLLSQLPELLAGWGVIP